MIIHYCKECGAREPGTRLAYQCDVCKQEFDGYLMMLEAEPEGAFRRVQVLICGGCKGKLPAELLEALAGILAVLP